MANQESIVEHLKMVQGVINRMAQTSFILKGWMITVVITILGVSLGLSNNKLGLLALFPVLIFWGLDAYYLRQERLFRGLYELILQDPEHTTIPPFSMKTDYCKDSVPSWWSSLFSQTECVMYLSSIAVILVVSFII